MNRLCLSVDRQLPIQRGNLLRRQNVEGAQLAGMVDTRGLEPLTIGLQSSGILSIRSLLCTGFQCFQQFGKFAFRSPQSPIPESCSKVGQERSNEKKKRP
jgi:hypothetical protein